MKERINQQLFAYWNTVRGERAAPRRFDIEPSRIAAILPDTFILECETPDRTTFRLAGTRVCDVFGREFRSLGFLALWSQADSARLQAALPKIVDEGQCGTLALTLHGPDGLSVSAEIALLPLVHTGDRVNRILGALAPATRPSWLGRLPVERVSLEGIETVWPDGRPHAVIARMDRQSPFLAEPRYSRIVTSERRAFRVYDGGRAED